MKPGDLVNFVTKAWVMSDDKYIERNPGIIIASRINKHEILWANGTISTEHYGYLEILHENR